MWPPHPLLNWNCSEERCVDGYVNSMEQIPEQCARLLDNYRVIASIDTSKGDRLDVEGELLRVVRKEDSCGSGKCLMISLLLRPSHERNQDAALATKIGRIALETHQLLSGLTSKNFLNHYKEIKALKNCLTFSITTLTALTTKNNEEAEEDAEICLAEKITWLNQMTIWLSKQITDAKRQRSGSQESEQEQNFLPIALPPCRLQELKPLSCDKEEDNWEQLFNLGSSLPCEPLLFVEGFEFRKEEFKHELIDGVAVPIQLRKDVDRIGVITIENKCIEKEIIKSLWHYCSSGAAVSQEICQSFLVGILASQTGYSAVCEQWWEALTNSNEFSAQQIESPAILEEFKYVDISQKEQCIKITHKIAFTIYKDKVVQGVKFLKIIIDIHLGEGLDAFIDDLQQQLQEGTLSGGHTPFVTFKLLVSRLLPAASEPLIKEKALQQLPSF